MSSFMGQKSGIYAQVKIVFEAHKDLTYVYLTGLKL